MTFTSKGVQSRRGRTADYYILQHETAPVDAFYYWMCWLDTRGRGSTLVHTSRCAGVGVGWGRFVRRGPDAAGGGLRLRYCAVSRSMIGLCMPKLYTVRTHAFGGMLLGNRGEWNPIEPRLIHRTDYYRTPTRERECSVHVNAESLSLETKLKTREKRNTKNTGESLRVSATLRNYGSCGHVELCSV